MMFKKLVVLDPVLLTDKQWRSIGQLARDVQRFSKFTADEILSRLETEMGESAQPMCWTQLAAEKVTEKELRGRLKGADAVITCWTSIPDAIVDDMPELGYVGFWTNLASHRINLKLANDRSIYVTYLPGYGTEAVAEMTLAGMLAVSRRLFAAARDTQRGRWPYELLKTGRNVPAVDSIREHMLAGRTLGIIGFGRIGKRVAELAHAFRMNVIYHSRNRDPEWEARGARFTSLEELCAGSDVVSVHLSPYAPEKTVSAEHFRLMRTGTLFINTSAGRLIDQDALLQGLETGRLRAYLDVYEGLPPRARIKQHQLADSLFTYRSGWFTRESVVLKGEMLLQNMRAFLRGEPEPPLLDEADHREHRYDIPCAKLIE